MNLTVYTAGDMDYLEAVLNGAAMVFQSGSVASLARIGMLIGILTIFLQSITAGARNINFGSVFVAWIVYSGLFGIGATTAIQHVNSGDTRIVANVPLGVATAGTVFSRMGRGLTDLFETAFSTANSSSTGIGGSLSMVQAVNVATLNGGRLPKSMSVDNSDVWQSWVNYIADCTSVKMRFNENLIREISKESDIIQALRYESVTNGTKYRVNSSSFVEGTCVDAHNVLAPFTQSTVYDALLEEIAQRTTFPAGLVQDGLTLQMLLQQALDDMFGFSKPGFSGGSIFPTVAMPAKTYILNNVMRRIFDDGQAQRYEMEMRDTLATEIRDAQRQRAARWYGEKALFASLVGPLSTILEGLAYALMPFLGLLVTMGPLGVKTIGSYLLILLWVQLWMPLNALGNFFTMLAVQRAVGASMVDGTLGVGSMDMLFSLEEHMADALGLAQYFSATVPFLAMFVLGGMRADKLVGWAEKAIGGGEFNAEVPARQTLATTPSVAIDAAQQMLRVGDGYVSQGPNAKMLLNNLSGSIMNGADVSSARQVLDQQAHTAGSSLVTDAFNSAAHGTNATNAGMKVIGDVASGTSAFGALLENTDGWLEKYATSRGLTRPETATLMAGVGAAAKGGVNIGDAQMAALIESSADKIVASRETSQGRGGSNMTYDAQGNTVTESTREGTRNTDQTERSTTNQNTRATRRGREVGLEATLNAGANVQHSATRSTGESKEAALQLGQSLRRNEATLAQHVEEVGARFSKGTDRNALRQSGFRVSDQTEEAFRRVASATESFEKRSQLADRLGVATPESMVTTLARAGTDERSRLSSAVNALGLGAAVAEYQKKYNPIVLPTLGNRHADAEAYAQMMVLAGHMRRPGREGDIATNAIAGFMSGAVGSPLSDVGGAWRNAGMEAATMHEVAPANRNRLLAKSEERAAVLGTLDPQQAVATADGRISSAEAARAGAVDAAGIAGAGFVNTALRRGGAYAYEVLGQERQIALEAVRTAVQRTSPEMLRDAPSLIMGTLKGVLDSGTGLVSGDFDNIRATLAQQGRDKGLTDEQADLYALNGMIGMRDVVKGAMAGGIVPESWRDTVSRAGDALDYGNIGQERDKAYAAVEAKDSKAVADAVSLMGSYRDTEVLGQSVHEYNKVNERKMAES